MKNKKVIIIALISIIALVIAAVVGFLVFRNSNSPEKAAINIVKASLENDGEKVVDFYPDFSVESICKFYQVETKEELAKIVERNSSYPNGADYEIISAERVEKFSDKDDYTFKTAFFSAFEDEMAGKELAYVIVKAKVNGDQKNIKVAIIKCDSKWCCMGIIWN